MYRAYFRHMDYRTRNIHVYCACFRHMDYRTRNNRVLCLFCFVSICKYLLTAGLREYNFNVTQSWPGILKFSSCKQPVLAQFHF